MLTIAITAACYPIKTTNHLWCNGLNQNCIYLAMMLEKMNHFVYLVHNDLEKFKVSSGLPKHLNLIHPDDLHKIHFNMIITMGHSLKVPTMAKYKELYPNCKHVLYVCGNTFVNTVEKTLFTENNCGLPKYNYDQIWVIPQMEKTSIDYLKFYYDTDKVTVIPFIWSPYAGEKFIEESKQTKEYEFQPIQSIAVLEPNMSVAKHFIFPLMVAEDFLKKGNEFKYMYIMCAEKFRKHPNLMDILKGTRLHKDKKVSAEHRYPVLTTLNKWADLVISFQWENPLNYLYLDVAWWGWPVVHNADYCQDIGYYYSEFNVQEATAAMKFAFENHPKDTTYKTRMRQLIRRYTSDNPQLIKDYERLLDDVMHDKFQKWTYQWRTNSIY
jgi:hypothetical protein